MDDRDVCLVIIGAGASFDCISPRSRSITHDHLPDRDFEDVRPPLTKDLVRSNNRLMNHILLRWPPAQPVVDYLRRALSRNDSRRDALSDTQTLERALKDYQRQPFPENTFNLLGFTTALRDLLWTCTDYMQSQDLDGGITNYHTLVRHLLSWASSGDRRVVLVSFNYDLLLERACMAAWDFEPYNLNSYLGHDRVSILKPHGSVQWGWPIRGEPTALPNDVQQYGMRAIRLGVENGFDSDDYRVIQSQFLDASGPFFRWTPKPQGELLVPAMTLPIAEKSDFTWPSDQSDEFDSLAGSVSKLLVIGWRGLDLHLLQRMRPLIRETANVMIVTGGDPGSQEAAEIGSRIAAYIDTPQYKFGYSGTGFSSDVDTKIPAFLAASEAEMGWS